MRSLPEWIGASPDTAIPDRVRLRVFERANGACEDCTRKLYPGDAWECDHVIALINGGENRESNLGILCEWCHKKKTRSDVAAKAVTYRKKRKHYGMKKLRTITRWRRFNGEPVTATRER